MVETEVAWGDPGFLFEDKGWYVLMCVCVCDALAQLHLYNTDSYKNASQGGSCCESGTVSAVRGTSSQLQVIKE